MQYIYRVENKKGLGCYRELVYELPFLLNHSTSNGHPVPYNDKGIDREYDEDEIHGFKNLDQVMRWFTNEELNHMNKRGQVLKRVKVKKITAIGECQVLAVR